MIKVNLGSISCGTLRSVDLIPCFIDVLDDLIEQFTFERTLPVSQVKEYVARMNDELATIEQRMNQEDSEYFDSGEASEDCDHIIDLINELCPPYIYFGAHFGDGADYGFLPDILSLEEDARFNDNVIKVNAGDPWPELDDSINFVMEVTDHGNVTLFDRDRNEIWSCV